MRPVYPNDVPASKLSQFPDVALIWVIEIEGRHVDTGADVVFRFSSEGFATRSTDVPKNKPIEGRLKKAPYIERKLGGSDGIFAGVAEVSAGDVVLRNDDGALDELPVKYVIDGRPVRMLVGSKRSESGGLTIWPYADFGKVAEMRADSWSWAKGEVRVRLKDMNLLLRKPMQDQVYFGPVPGQTGPTLSGSEALRGHSKPLTYGLCAFISPALLDQNVFIFQYHSDGPVGTPVGVFDMGASIPRGVARSGFAALVATSPAATTYDSATEVGAIRVGTKPVGTLTIHALGDASTPESQSGLWEDGTRFTDGTRWLFAKVSGPVTLLPEILAKILYKRAEWPVGFFDEDSFLTASRTRPLDKAGIYIGPGEQTRIIEVAERIAKCFHAFCGPNRLGRYEFKVLSPPESTPLRRYGSDQIIDIERLDLPYGVPWSSWTARYNKRWTVQTNTVGDVQSQSDLATEYSSYTRTNPSILAAHPTSAGGVIETYFVDKPAAERTVTQYLAFYSFGRAMYSVGLRNALFVNDIGETIELEWPRWDLQAGKNFVVVGVREDASSRETQLTVFG